MSRRISEAIVGVSAAILLVLGVPLALAVHQLILNNEVVSLQSSAARTLAEIAVPLNPQQLAGIRRERDAPPPFSVYDPKGHCVFGDGPTQANPLVRRALRGNPATSSGGGIEVALPITDRATNEHIIGAVHLTASLRQADHRVRVAWLIMAASAAGAIGAAWLVGNRLARRMSQPISDLADHAQRIGDGGSGTRREPSGIREIDTLSSVLADSTDRVNDALARERRFSADVSHQLRTPLTALRLHLETARDRRDVGALNPALADLARLEATVAHLLAVAREAIPAASRTHLGHLPAQAKERWAARAASHHRTLRIDLTHPGFVAGSEASITQVLDVLIDNAIIHGEGDIDISVRHIAGGAAIDVQDQGSPITLTEADSIFDRGYGRGHGIGLALARSLAAREGGSLVITHLRPTTFSLILLGDHSEPSAGRA